MNVINLRPIKGEGTLVALFDLRVSPEIILQDWQLRDTPKGLRSFPPSPRNGRSTAFVEPKTFTEIGRLAREAFEGGSAQYVDSQ